MSELFVVTRYLEERGVAISQIHPLENLDNICIHRVNLEMLALPNPFFEKKNICVPRF